MKQLRRLFHSQALTQGRGPLLAGLAALAVVALCSSGVLTHAQAAGGPPPPHAPPPPPPPPPPAPPEEAELLQLLADFHGALSYHDINVMMDLWADDCSLSFTTMPTGGTTTTYVGKDNVKSFFLAGGYFNPNLNWVSLAPEYKTQITIQGDKAAASTQCIAIDVDPSSSTFHQVKSVITVNSTAQKVHGKWLYTSMNNTGGETL